MLVILKRGWFVGGNRYRSVAKSPVAIPDKYRNILPKGAIIIEEPIEHAQGEVHFEDASEEALLEDAPEDILFDEDAPEEKPYVNPAHALDPARQFAEAFSDVNEKAKDEVHSFREQLKNSKKGE